MKVASELTSIHGDGDGINAKTSSSSVPWSSSTRSSSQPAVYNFPAASAALSRRSFRAQVW